MSRYLLVLLLTLFLTGCIAPQTFEYYRAEGDVASKELRQGWCQPYALNELMVEDGVRTAMRAFVSNAGIAFIFHVELEPERTFRLTLPRLTIRFADSLSSHTVELERFSIFLPGGDGKSGQSRYYSTDSTLVGVKKSAKYATEELRYSIYSFSTRGFLPDIKPPNSIFVSVPEIEIDGKPRRLDPIAMQLVRRTVLVSQCG